MSTRSRTAVSTALAAALLCACASTDRTAGSQTPAVPSEWSGALGNFGFPLTFSTRKMDLSVDPRQDFYRFGSGKWLEAAAIPDDAALVTPFDNLIRRVDRQLASILEDAAARSGQVPKGTPVQQVGDLYASAMDETRLRQLGVAPLQPAFDRIASLDSAASLARAALQFGNMMDDPVMLGVGIGTDPTDRTRYVVYLTDSELGLRSNDVYLKPEFAGQREEYRKFIADMLVIAGTPSAQAAVDAQKVLAYETRIAAKKLAPVDYANPSKRFVRMPLGEARRWLSNFDLDAFFAEMGRPPTDVVVIMQADAVRERNAAFKDMSLDDLKLMYRWDLIRHAHSFLTPAFQERAAKLNEALGGAATLAPRAQQVTGMLRAKFGHPLSRLYVEKHFSPASKRAAEDLVGRIRDEFRARLVSNQWLGDETRRYAIHKLDRATIRVGYPDRWIDTTGIDIRRDDLFGNIVRINMFKARRTQAKLGAPVQEDTFAISGATLPIDINAAFNPAANGIEIPAAFLQPPFYDPKADAAVNFCAVGAVIGHELTHGFDSLGRLYDADGAVRNWWADADAKRFAAEADKLVQQASRYEAAPGLRLNGALTVSENLADVGGISFAYGALGTYLREHPDARRPIDGLTPQQRCFLSWNQLWPAKSREGTLRQLVATDPHAYGPYRTFAPAQHEPGFYEAFGIRPGDPMWLDPTQRARVW